MNWIVSVQAASSAGTTESDLLWIAIAGGSLVAVTIVSGFVLRRRGRND